MSDFDDFNFDDDMFGDDDFFGGDIDFDMDFDNMDPFKDKGFFSSAGTGFLSHIYDNTLGSGDAQIRTLRTILPSTFSNALDRISFIKDKGADLIREFKEENFESVKHLQNIATQIGKRVENKFPRVKESLDGFASKDFSDWEKITPGSEKDINIAEVTDEEINALMARTMEEQTGMLGAVGESINEMAANVGGMISAGIGAGNRELIGIQSGIRELVSYNYKIQTKLEQAKIELLSRTLLTNVKFYKFMESAEHRVIRELRKISELSAKSDYEKTSLYTAGKEYMRNSLFSTVGKRMGGLLGTISSGFDRQGRSDKYNAIESLLGNFSDALELSDGMTMSRGMLGNMAGGLIGDWFLSNLPYMANQGPVASAIERFKKSNPEMAAKMSSGWGKLTNFGNKASYAATNGMELINRYAEDWEEMDENQYQDYEEYVEAKEKEGKKPLPEFLFKLLNSGSNMAKSTINSYMRDVSRSQGTKYVITRRKISDLSSPGLWKEINNITLNDVIPGWLSRIHTSLERSRTGDDRYVSPTYNYMRGQFLSAKDNKTVVESDLFTHSEFQSAATSASRLVGTMDNNKVLTDEERNQLALRIIQDVDKEHGFNPYYYLNGIDGFDKNTSDNIAKVIKNKFNITDEMIEEYNKGGLTDKLYNSTFGFNDEGAGALNEIGSMAADLKRRVPNIAEAFDILRSTGNENLLRELGVIYTKDGVSKLNTDKIWDRILQYLRNPEDPSLRGDIGSLGLTDSNDIINNDGTITLSGDPLINNSRNGNRRDSARASKDTRKLANKMDNYQRNNEGAVSKLNESTQKLSDTIDLLSERMSKQFPDFTITNNGLLVDLATMPSDITIMKDLLGDINEGNNKHEELLRKISECVCRQAGGWGAKDDREKEEIVRDEKEGKKTILERLKAISPRGLFNKGVDALLNNQPLVLGAAFGGLATLAMHDPKAALLVSGGIVAANAYHRLSDYAKGDEPSDDEDILDEDGNVKLSASKLKAGHYFQGDHFDKAVKKWKDISGAVRDMVSGAITTLAELTGKLFGRDGRAIILKGLDKIKSAANYVWKKIDIFGNLGKLKDTATDYFYQQDVYVKGEKEPRLVRKGFKEGKYFRYDTSTNQAVVIKGWNEIKGPVYGEDRNQIITEEDIKKGLVTSTGVQLDKMQGAAKTLGKWSLQGLIKTKDYLGEKAGQVKDAANDMFKTDFSGVESRLDNIYNLLLRQFGLEPDFVVNPVEGFVGPIKPATTNEKLAEEKAKEKDVKTKLTVQRDPTGDVFSYPDQLSKDSFRLNSLEYKDQKEKEEKTALVQDKLIEMADNIKEIKGEGGDGKDGKKKGGLLGLLGGAGSFLSKLIRNPFKTLGGAFISEMLKAPGRVITLGSLLFKGVASPILSMLGWGFSGLMWGIRKLIFTNTTESFGEWFRTRKDKKAGRRTRRRSRMGRMRNMKLGGKLGKVLKIGAGLGMADLAFGGPMSKSLMGDDKVSNGISSMINSSSEDFDKFFNGDDDRHLDDNSNENEGFSFGAEEAIMFGGAGLGTYGAYKAGKNALKPGGRIASAGASAGASAEAGAKALGKLGRKALPVVGAALMAMDFYEGSTDKEMLRDIYDKDIISGTEALASGVTNTLDLGFSYVLNKVSDWTGLEFLRPEGGTTKLLSQLLTSLGDSPLSYILPMGSMLKMLNGMEVDIALNQKKIRLSQYGIHVPLGPLGKRVMVLEQVLDQFVKFNQARAWLDEKTPIEAIIDSFSKTGTGFQSKEEIMVWFEKRFKPIYLTYQSGIRTVGYDNLKEFDLSKNPDVIKVINAVKDSLAYVEPFPYDIVNRIDSTEMLMDRKNTQTQITVYEAELKKDFKEDGINEDGISEKINLVIKTKEENTKFLLDTESKGFWENINYKSLRKEEEYALENFKEDIKVLNIDISDLHNDKEELDYFTMARLGIYGMDYPDDQIKPWRVDAVLRLERYCEDYAIYSGGNVAFTGNPYLVYRLFKNTFRSPDGKYAEEDWLNWFNYRFMPVFKDYFAFTWSKRRAKPKDVWKSLTWTNKFDIALALSGTIVVYDGKQTPVWDLDFTPFHSTGGVRWKSGTDSARIERYLKAMELMSKDAKLRTPGSEIMDSQDLETQKKINDERERIQKDSDAMMKRLSQKGSIGGQTNYNQTNASGNYGGSYNGTTDVSYLEVDNKPGGSYNGPVAGMDYTPNSTKVSGSSPGNDLGVAIDPKDGEQMMLRALVNEGITDNKQIALALAMAKYETGNYQKSAEDTRWSAKTLYSHFKNVKSMDQARELASKSPNERVAFVYGNNPKARELGNKGPQDGFDYKGRGYFQLTGRGNYERFSNSTGIDIVSNPKLVSEDPRVSALVSAKFMKNNKQMMSIADGVPFAKAAQGLNGGLPLPKESIGPRTKYYQEYLNKLQSGSFGIEKKNAEETAEVDNNDTTVNATYNDTQTNDASSGQDKINSVVDKAMSDYNSQYNSNSNNTNEIEEVRDYGGDEKPYENSVGSSSGKIAGLIIKNTKQINGVLEPVAGGNSHKGITELAKVIQSKVSNFKWFSAFNDYYHKKNSPNSYHTRGLALDFTLTDNGRSSPNACQVVREILNNAGLVEGKGRDYLLLDEYKRPSSKATAGHIHFNFESEASANKYLSSTKGNKEPTLEDISKKDPTLMASKEPPVMDNSVSNDNVTNPIIPSSTNQTTTNNTSNGYSDDVVNRETKTQNNQPSITQQTSSSAVGNKVGETIKQEVIAKLPEGPLQVKDEGLASAVNNLAKALLRTSNRTSGISGGVDLN